MLVGPPWSCDPSRQGYQSYREVGAGRILDCPDPRQRIHAALERHLGRELALELIKADVFGLDQAGSVAHLLGEAAGVPVAEIAQVADFASHPALVDKVDSRRRN